MGIDKRWLPPTTNKLLMDVVIALALPYAAVAIGLVRNLVRAPQAIVAIALFLLLAWGLWRLKKWARWITVGVLWLLAIPLPLGMLSPFAAGDLGDYAPSRTTILVVILPLMMACVYALHVLGKYKSEFRW